MESRDSLMSVPGAADDFDELVFELELELEPSLDGETVVDMLISAAATLQTRWDG